jgi:hypothetical protein
MNLARALRVLACVSAWPASYRGIGSANGNRTCYQPVQHGLVRSISFILRPVGTEAMTQCAPRVADVPVRCQQGRAARLQ